MLHIEGLHIYYGYIHALKGIDLEIHAGEVVALSRLFACEAEQRHKAVLELLCCLLRECAEENRLGRYTPKHDQIHHAPQEDASFSRARPGNEKERAIGVQNGAALVLVRREAHPGEEQLDHLRFPFGCFPCCATCETIHASVSTRWNRHWLRTLNAGVSRFIAILADR